MQAQSITPQAYPAFALEGNFCRNPDRSADGVWCFTGFDGTDREPCEVPKCDLMLGFDAPQAPRGGGTRRGRTVRAALACPPCMLRARERPLRTGARHRRRACATCATCALRV
jgi:hypothetical protein